MKKLLLSCALLGLFVLSSPAPTEAGPLKFIGRGVGKVAGKAVRGVGKVGKAAARPFGCSR